MMMTLIRGACLLIVVTSTAREYYFCADNKRVHQELRRAAADVTRLQKKARKGEYIEVEKWEVWHTYLTLVHPASR